MAQSNNLQDAVAQLVELKNEFEAVAQKKRNPSITSKLFSKLFETPTPRYDAEWYADRAKETQSCADMISSGADENITKAKTEILSLKNTFYFAGNNLDQGVNRLGHRLGIDNRKQEVLSKNSQKFEKIVGLLA